MDVIVSVTVVTVSYRCIVTPLRALCTDGMIINPQLRPPVLSIVIMRSPLHVACQATDMLCLYLL